MRSWEPNPEQRTAVEARGHVFVSAGAGTGKTAVLVERFVQAVCDEGLDVDSVLVITYTKRAAGELRARIRAELAGRGRFDLARRLDGAWISTIHSFCNRLLKAYPFAAGLDPRFRELDEAQAAVLRGEAFDGALEEFCAGDDPDRLRLLASYGAGRLRGMLIGVYETLRAAGRELVLELGDAPPLDEAVGELREAAACLVADADSSEAQRAAAGALLERLGSSPRAERLIELADFRARGERAAGYEEARRRVEHAALDTVAAGDRDLLQLLLEGFAAAYRASKERESVLDFEDLQLLARDVLRDQADIREREQLRFRRIMVDEFQDTNRLQCDLIDLVSGVHGRVTGSRGVAGKGGESEGRRAVRESTAEARGRSILPPAASGDGEAGLRPAGADAARGLVADVFTVGDEFQSIYGFRHADVQVFRDRRDRAGGGLALSRNYRSRPEVLAAVNHLFAEEFGDEFQPLAASGDFPDPVFGHPVELLIVDKASYADTGVHWRRGEARAIARRVRELVDSGAAAPGEIVLLFAAGTDAEWYEEELRQLDLPTYRGTGRGYFGQQQVVDLLAYLSLLRNRYDDVALLTVLASPFVGVSNDALVLIRGAAGRRPLFTGIEYDLPDDLDERDGQLIRAFKQRYERLLAASQSRSLERLCEQIVAEHDYDLAVLAQWDGRRRYANLRKLARLARSYEDLRGADIEGFVRFVRAQEAVGAKELEAVAQEEGGDAVRLLTIHAAKGLEFKVVIVADAGRDRVAPRSDEILALSDGRFGFRVADPLTSRPRGAFAYDEVKEAREAEERAERLRLYYVAMTRAIDRLIVSGAIDFQRRADERTPIGWVLSRLGAVEELSKSDGTPVELVRNDARLLVRVERCRPEPDGSESIRAKDGQLQLFDAVAEMPLRPALELPPIEPVPAPAFHRPRALSYSALSLYEQCSYKYFVRYVVGMREREAEREDGERPLGALAVGSAVHEVLETLDLGSPTVPGDLAARFPEASHGEAERIAAFVKAYCSSELAARLARLDGVVSERPFAFVHEGVRIHGFIDVLHRDGQRALVVDFKTNALGEASPTETVDADYRLQRLVYALACFRAGAEEVEVVYQFLERPEELVSTHFSRDEVAGLEDELSAAIASIEEGRFVPTPSELACAGCPALDLVCAGPRLRNPGRRLTAVGS